jgi:hypothetical protein
LWPLQLRLLIQCSGGMAVEARTVGAVIHGVESGIGTPSLSRSLLRRK